MPGASEFSQLFLAYFIPLISAVAIITDIVMGRIFNWLTVSAFVVGLGLAFYTSGIEGLFFAFLGGLAGLALFGGLFVLHVMGGGDVKFLMALGALGGPKYVLEVAILSVLTGGILAATLLLVKGRLPDFSRRMFRFLMTLFVRELELEAPKVDRNLTMPFGVPIAIAAVWVFFKHPLHSWGVFPWL